MGEVWARWVWMGEVGQMCFVCGWVWVYVGHMGLCELGWVGASWVCGWVWVSVGECGWWGWVYVRMGG